MAQSGREICLLLGAKFNRVFASHRALNQPLLITITPHLLVDNFADNHLVKEYAIGFMVAQDTRIEGFTVNRFTFKPESQLINLTTTAVVVRLINWDSGLKVNLLTVKPSMRVSCATMNPMAYSLTK